MINTKFEIIILANQKIQFGELILDMEEAKDIFYDLKIAIEHSPDYNHLTELARFDNKDKFTPQRARLRKAATWLKDSTPGGRRKRLFMAMIHCFAGLFCKTP